jgi:hypothetical protein
VTAAVARLYHNKKRLEDVDERSNEISIYQWAICFFACYLVLGASSEEKAGARENKQNWSQPHSPRCDLVCARAAFQLYISHNLKY